MPLKIHYLHPEEVKRLREQGVEIEELQLKDLDVHTETAKEIFGTEDVTDEQRAFAKRLNWMHLYRR